MEERKVPTQDGITWSCVLAYAGLSSATEAANTPAPEGTVTLVCTPSGKAQTVRLELEAAELSKLTDEELVRQIEQSRQ